MIGLRLAISGQISGFFLTLANESDYCPAILNVIAYSRLPHFQPVIMSVSKNGKKREGGGNLLPSNSLNPQVTD